MPDKEVGKMLEPVSLGYSEGDVVSAADLDDPFLCKLGGKPVWLDRSSSIPSHSTIMCVCCGSEMTLLVQTYVPLDGSPFDRGEDQSQPSKSRKASQKEARADEVHEEWTDERYEQAVLPKGMDAAFSRFATVVGQNPEQVIRYQHGGIPLLYSLQDSAARTLISKDKQSQKILLRPKEKHLSCKSHQHQNRESGNSYDEDDDDDEDDYDDDDDDDDDDDNGASGAQLSQRYTTENLPRCPACGGRRIFECQLMPALLTELPLSSQASAIQKKPHFGAEGSSQNRLVGSQLLHSFDLGVEFGTIMVFVCENDCHGGKTGVDYLGENAQSMAAYAPAAYYEELVLVQQETHVD
ncbi:hypothetical protein LPJ72_000780 [Coemansia sp. Benny D160-2]|nr:hypothetical protein LPJ72_000780 [Coemansia sp. Benny D160-2]